MHLLFRILYTLGLYTFPTEDLYGAFLCGEISATTLFSLLRAKQIDSFLRLHDQIKQAVENKMEGEQDFSPKLLDAMVRTLQIDRRRLWLSLTQIDYLIDRDLEKQVKRTQGRENVIRREL